MANFHILDTSDSLSNQDSMIEKNLEPFGRRRGRRLERVGSARISFLWGTDGGQKGKKKPLAVVAGGFLIG